MRKLVIIINGAGGAGKDTIVDIVGKHYRVMNRSSIDPIKNAAEVGGVNPKEFKTARGRRFLSDLKRLFIDYEDTPTKYLVNEFVQFAQGKDEVMFAHIREPYEILKFRTHVFRMNHPYYYWRRSPDVKVCTLLIEGRDDHEYGNSSDDNVRDFTYDYTYKNTGPLEDMESDFMEFFEKIIEEQKR